KFVAKKSTFRHKRISRKTTNHSSMEISTKVDIREAEEKDLSGVLLLYGQRDLDDGDILSQEEALVIFRKMKKHPDYRLYVAIDHQEIVGTFTLLIMDNL